MSRKTRKLIWSVPLVAVFAITGALAIFAALAPAGAQAQEVMVPGPVTDLDAVAKTRTSIELTWEAPSSASGGTPTGYRIDHSSHNRVWTLLKDDTGRTATRYLIDTDVKADTERYYRVFAMNEAGTGPVSVDPVTAYASVPVTFPPTEPARVALTLTLDAKDPYGKIILTWTESDNNGSAIESYKIVEMIDHDEDGATAREECGSNAVDGSANDPGESPTPLAGECLQILAQPASEDRMAMHGNLTGGESHYYRVIAINAVGDGAPSDTRGITTRTPRKPAAPTEPIAVPLDDTDNSIELYWLEPTSTGGHPLGDFRVEVQAQVRLADNPKKWGTWSEWTSLNVESNDATNGDYAPSATVTVKNGEATDPEITLNIGFMPMPYSETNGAITLGDPWNLRITGASAGQYRFQIKSKQSGDADRGLDLESGWVRFNRPSRAGLGHIIVPVANIFKTQIPLEPELTAEALDAAEVKDQGIGLTWDPEDTPVDNVDHDDDTNTDGATDLINDVVPPQPSDYRIDLSEDGVKWERGQTRTISLRKWDHEGLDSQEVRYYRLFPINHGQFGEAGTAGAQARKAVIASPDQVLNLRQKSATTTSITMEWDSISAAAEYALYSAAPGDDNDALPDDWPEAATMTLEGTEYTDSKNLNPGNTRWYRVVPLSDNGDPVTGADGAEALGKTAEAGEPGAPVGLVAQEAFDSSLTGSDDRGVLLLWDEPTESGKDPHTSYTVEWKSDTMTGDAWETLVTDTSNLEDQTALSTHYHHDVELGTDEQRAYQVKALSGSGSGMASNVSYYPPMASMAELGMPGNAMSLMAGSPDDSDPAAIKLTWEAGANATTHTVAGVLRNADGTFDTSTAIWMTDVTSPLKVGMDDRPEGTYIFGVVAGLIDGTDREWSDWARATVAYPQ